MIKIIFITILSILLLAGCSGTEISNEITIKETEPTSAEVEILSETADETTIPEAEQFSPEIEIAIAIPTDTDPTELYLKIESDFNTALLSTPQSWIMMPLDGGIITDDFILVTAFTVYEIYKETEAGIIKDEKGLYLPVEIMQKTVDILFADPPEIDTYTFGNLYRNSAEYNDCIFMPFEFYEDYKYNGDKYWILNNTFLYNTETNNITCALGFYKMAADEKFVELEYHKRFSLSPLIINGKTYYRFNELLDYGVSNIQPDQLTDTITDYRDWEQLGLNETDERYLFIKAFVNGDTRTLEYLANVMEKGVYDSYKSIVFGDYTIKRTDKSPISPLNQRRDGFIIFDFDILSSENEVLCAGHHSVLIEPTLCMQMIDYTNYVMFPNLTEAQKIIQLFGNTSFPDFKTKNYKGYYNISPVYILSRLSYTGNNKTHSAEEIIAYAKKYFDIDDYKINEDEVNKTQNGYEIIAMGASFLSCNFISEEIRDGITVVTIQFWADLSQTVKSVLVEFYLEPLDGDFKPLYSVILEDTGYITACMGI